MDTPICDFVRDYARREPLRLHMPGHKGGSLLGMERLDITEISGADSLYEAAGIIARSEENAGALFGCRTVYSTEGASQCIRAMLYLVRLHGLGLGRRPRVLAGRNAHKAFLSGAALLDMEVEWLYPQSSSGYLSCDITAEELDRLLETAEEKPAAVYLTSPDYLGKMADIPGIARVCHNHGVLLAVDNAHGAYLKFLPESLHPMDLGADICCDSAHKTLPGLTGAAYLHLSPELDRAFGSRIKDGLMLFGSTSPSYLILQSLDAVNLYLETYPRKLCSFTERIRGLKSALTRQGYRLYGSEPLKLTVDAKAYGYEGEALAEYLRRQDMEPEFADRDYLVLMLTPELPETALKRLEEALCALPPRPPIDTPAPEAARGEPVLSLREAMLADSELLPVHRCLGRILAVPNLGCPPAVPILVCGERITSRALEAFAYYGITHCRVVREAFRRLF